ncbi:MAG: hypothetical protein AAF926_00350 [Pseudomonadota bacterium]
MRTRKLPDGTVERIVEVKDRQVVDSDLQAFLNQNPEYNAA